MVSRLRQLSAQFNSASNTIIRLFSSSNSAKMVSILNRPFHPVVQRYLDMDGD